MANFGNAGGKKPTNRSGGRSGPPAPLPQAHIVEPKCKICKCEYRREVDHMLATSWAQRAVRDWLNATFDLKEGEPGWFSDKNVSNHKIRHMSVEDTAVRKITEAKARQFGVDLDTVEGFILTREAALELITHNGLQNMMKGLTSAQPQDIIAATKQLAEWEKETRETAVDELMRDYRAFSEAVQEKLGEMCNLTGLDMRDVMAEIARIYDRKLEEQSAILELMPSQIYEHTESADE